jgi:hypothetical protein
MTNFRKVVSTLLSVSTALALTGFNLASPVQGAQLKEASVSLADPRPSTSTSHTISFKIATTNNVGSVQLVYANTASGSGLPTGLTTNANTTITAFTIPGNDLVNWTRTNPSNGTIRFFRSSATAATANDTWTITLPAITNNSQLSACDAVTNSDSCWVQINTYSDTGWTTGVDSTTATYTITDSVTVTATVDPILTFTVAAVTSGNLATNDSNAGTGTAVTSTATTLPFGNVTVGTAKLAQHQLNTQTNANNGYTVFGKFITAGDVVMAGNAVASNNIDRFTASSATWSSPQTWAAPTGTAANVNSAWLGVRTTDLDVAGFNVSDRYGPPDILADSGSGRAVMSSTGPDNGTTPHYVTFKIQANAFQPADLYTGTWVYNVLASY